MRKFLATVVFVLVSAAVAHAGPLTPPICAPGTGGLTSPECLPGPPVLGPLPVAGEGFMPIGANPIGGTVGPRVDWIVRGAPISLVGPGSGGTSNFLYLYQIESASGAPPVTTGTKAIVYDDGSTCTPATTPGGCRDPRGDISRFTLTTGLLGDPFHNFTAFGFALGDLDNDGTRLFFGTAVPTGAKIAAATLVPYGAAVIAGHNCGNFGNLGPGPVPGDTHACVDVGAPAPSESEINSTSVAFGDAEGDEIGVATVQADATLLAWDFVRKIRHGNPGTPEESVILWALGPNPFYGGAAALDGDPFSPWSTLHTNGRPVPVAGEVPEPASLLLLGSGLLAAGVITRRFHTRKS